MRSRKSLFEGSRSAVAIFTARPSHVACDSGRRARDCEAMLRSTASASTSSSALAMRPSRALSRTIESIFPTTAFLKASASALSMKTPRSINCWRRSSVPMVPPRATSTMPAESRKANGTGWLMRTESMEMETTAMDLYELWVCGLLVEDSFDWISACHGQT